jgi:mono/diheme cytochrome c family protein
MELKRPIRLLAALSALGLFLVGCGGGAETVALPAPPGGVVSSTVYTGPPPQTEDIQAFQVNLWENIRSTQRCGACHGEGGQAPSFANNEDVNAAYAAANTIIDLDDPVSSEMVTKVGGGHNCWETDDQFCADQLTGWIENWAGDSASEKQVVQLQAPPARDPGASKVLTSAEQGLFQTELHQPILTVYCASCHAEDGSQPQSPFFASSDINTAFDDVRVKVNLDNPAESRLVVRLRSEFHNCWTDCSANADEVQAAIQRIADQVDPTQVDPDLVASDALLLDDGIVASSGGRVEDDVIALYQFRTGSGSTAFDSSGIEPALHLTLSGSYEWVGGWGVRINSGRAQGTTDASRKLTRLIQSTGEYSIEAWVAPGNVTLDGPARIVSYSGGNDERNFMLGQTLYDYNFHTRSSVSDADGEPALSTPSADEVLQATLQHVVVTYSVTQGRKLWVNGRLISEDMDSGGLADWNDSFAFLLGNEVSGQRQWQGVLRLVAVHNRALPEEDVLANFEAGVGEKFFLLFGVGGVGGIPERTYVLFQVSQFDSYAYLFETPHLVNLDGADLSGIQVAGLRIGINGHEADIGQAWVSLDETVGSGAVSDPAGPLGHRLSRLGSIIGIENGVEADEFFLTFDQIGTAQGFRTDSSQPRPIGQDVNADYASLGLRTFEEIAASMSVLTGVDRTDPRVAQAYDRLKQQLPTIENITSFLSAQQVGVAQLAMQYCDAMVEDAGASVFPDVEFGSPPTVAFANAGERLDVIDPLIDMMLGPVQLDTQPVRSDVVAHLDQVITETMDCLDTGGATISGCTQNPARTRSVVKAACASLLGSATLLIQ